MSEEVTTRKRLVRELEREALTRMEDAARTTEDFKEIIRQWNRLDANRQRRERDHEVGRPNAEMLHWDRIKDGDEKGQLKKGLDRVIPIPFDSAWWRQLLVGDFLDMIFDCPYEMHEQTAWETISKVLQTLNENQMEVMYYRVIRQYSPQKIAALRGDTDRNIRKVYTRLIENLRNRLYAPLLEEYNAKSPLPLEQRQFVEARLLKQTPANKKKPALDSVKDE